MRSENIANIGIANQPRIVLQFALNLARPPTGITQKKPHFFGPAPMGGIDQHIGGLGQRNGQFLRQGVLGFFIIARMQHKSVIILHRPADINRQIDQPGTGDGFGHVFQNIAQRQPFGAFIDDKTHRAFAVMGHHIDDTAQKPWVAHARHGVGTALAGFERAFAS